VFVERPAVVTPLAEHAVALTATYGCSDEALLDALFGRVSPDGRLPVALPRSMAAVVASPTDVPIWGDGALFPHGAGLALDRNDSG
jgi:beta-glucosidase